MGTWGGGGKERITNSLKRDIQVSRERESTLLLGAGSLASALQGYK